MSKLRWRQIGGKTAHGGKTERLFYGAPATRAAASSSHLLVHAGRWSCDGQVVWARASLFVVRVFMHQFSPVQCEPRQLHAANLCLLFVRGRQSFDAHSAWALATLFGTDVNSFDAHKANLSSCVCMRQSFDAHAVWALATLFGTGVSLLTPIRQIFPSVCVCRCVSHFDAHAAWAPATLFGTGVSLLTPIRQIFPVVCACVSLFDAHAAWAPATLFGTDVSLLMPMRQIFPVVCACVSHLTPMRCGLWQLFLGWASAF